MRYESLPSGQTGQGEEGDACLCGYGHFGHTAFSAICWNGYAIATHADRQARKCFLLLPMCPVYGLGALAVLALPESLSGSFWSLALWGGLAATAVEYAVHVLYDRLLGVRFWDYSQVRWNLRGRVCLPFSLAWSLLVAAGLPVIQAAIAPALAAVPPTATYAALLVFTADTVVSLQLLRRAGDPAVLSLGNLRAA